jgi:nucleotide-binding universal stress UspA family protein
MEEVFRNILLPVDGSTQSRIAQEMTAFLSKLFKSQVTLLHVVSNELPALAGQVYSSREDFVPVNTATYQFPRTIGLSRPRENVLPDEVIREITEHYRQKGQTVLTEIAARFTQQGITVKNKIVEGTDVAESIISDAETGNFDLIIMGNSGSDVSEFDLHLGSVAHKVLLRAKIPIMIVRNKRDIRKILVPVDGSVKEEKAMRKAQTLAKATMSTVILLHVQDASLLRLRPEIRGMGLQVLEENSNMFKGIQFEKRLVSGDPANVIIQTAKQEGADLIVMSKGELGTLKGLFLGSVSDHVLHHATVPVLLVK